MILDFKDCKTPEDVKKVVEQNKKLLKIASKFKKDMDKIAKKGGYKISVGFQGKETVISDFSKPKPNSSKED